MHIPTHVLSGWLIGNIPPLNKQQRLWCMFAAAAPDLDGLGIVISAQAYADYHHIHGHNWLAALVISAIAAGIFRSQRVLMAVMTCVLMHLHFFMDMLGSFRGAGIPWGIKYNFPFSKKSYAVDWGWELGAWQNYVITGIMIVIMIIIAIKARRTPLETLAPSLEKKLYKNE